MQLFSGMGMPIRAVEHVGEPIRRVTVVRDPALMTVATQAVASLDAAGPLHPTGIVRDALAAGRLPGSRDAATLDGIEHLLAHGTPDPATSRAIGNGMNNTRYATVVRGADGTSTEAVAKPETAQGAQEHFGWRVGRAIGIDHLVAPVGRAAGGDARIQFVEGASLVAGKVMDARSLRVALAQSHLTGANAVTPAEAAQAAKVESQLMHALDYVLANSDRNGGNGIVDARSGVQLIDHGHVGRGQAGRPDPLEPGMRGTFLDAVDGRVELDPVTVDFLRRRLDEPTLRSIHADTLRGEHKPVVRGEFGRFNDFASSTAFIDGAVARLHHLLDTGAFRYTSPGEGMGAPLRAVDEPPMRGGMAAARFGGGRGGFGMM